MEIAEVKTETVVVDVRVGDSVQSLTTDTDGIQQLNRVVGQVDLQQTFSTVAADERDAAIQAAAKAMGNAVVGVPVSVSIGAAAVLMVQLSDQMDNPEFDRKLADKLRQVADLLDAPEPTIGEWFAQAVQEPTAKTRSVQLGVHYEEVSEMMLATCDQMTGKMVGDLAIFYKSSCNDDPAWVSNPLDLLDSLCDQIVTANGVGYMFGFDMAGALAEVNRSNWSKFVDGKPIFDANGKIAKGPHYFKPDLTKYLTQQ